jgi:hypothetical protein
MIDTGDIINFKGFTITITFVDFDKKVGGFKIFKNIEEAQRDRHEISKRQCPEAHEPFARCLDCRGQV